MAAIHFLLMPNQCYHFLYMQYTLCGESLCQWLADSVFFLLIADRCFSQMIGGCQQLMEMGERTVAKVVALDILHLKHESVEFFFISKRENNSVTLSKLVCSWLHV